jgi:hypothetical protein
MGILSKEDKMPFLFSPREPGPQGSPCMIYDLRL